MAFVGMGGIGKTTFVKRIYNDSAVKAHFDRRGWATVSQEQNKRQVLLELCRSVMPETDSINTMNDDELAGQLLKRLKGMRYLIIVDDIWSTEAWDDIQRCFPAERTGSRILLTTRDKKVANHACPGTSVYDMRFLHPDESWTLFYQKLLVNKCLNKELETIGRKIVQKCHGLPLTVVVLAGRLSTNMAVHEWENVESMLSSSEKLNLSEQFSRILTLSYNNLPSHLKSCFMFLGVFPEDSEIEVKKVIRLWIAEGFIKEVSQMTLEELGESYLHELLNRSLILVGGRSSDGKIRTCRLHDMLRDLCVNQAKNEKLLHAEDAGYVVNSDSRWLSLRIVSPYSHFLVGSYNFRSILCFDMYTIPAHNWNLEVTFFKMLRVLDLRVIGHSERIPPDIMEIVLLRYLALPSNKLLTSIPVGKNRNLQTLIVCEDVNGTRELPRGIWDLPQLRHLEFQHQLAIYNPKVAQQNLQTMYWLRSIQCTKQVFSRIPNVKELGIIAGGIRCECCLDNLNHLHKLEKLKVQGSYSPIRLPQHVDTFPQNLKKITFSKTVMPWRAMSIIGMLPNLKVLKLKNHACLGRKWNLNEKDGFSGLKVLLISVTNLEDWEASDDVENPFPVLERLVLKNCFELKKMPSWIEESMKLNTIQFEHCNASLVSSAKKIKEDKLEYGGGAFEILEFPTQSEEDQNNSEREEIEDENNSETEEIEDEKNSDAQSVWIEARSLCIAWVYDPDYWSWIRNSGHEAIKLLKVCWLDIRGTLDTKWLLRMTSYSAYLVYKLEWGGGSIDPALVSVRYLKDRKTNSMNERCQVVLAECSRSSRGASRFPHCRRDGWMEIKLGEFYVSSGNEGEVEMRLWNIENMDWKYGLIVRGIEVRPKMKVGSKCGCGVLKCVLQPLLGLIDSAIAYCYW